jgi:small subunit ribosomal protein S17
MSSQTTKSIKSRRGVVLKNVMDKTVVVETVRRMRHAKYGKFVKRRLRYKAHDPQNVCSVGDVVLVNECRPISKSKRWVVREIVQKAVDL